MRGTINDGLHVQPRRFGKLESQSAKGISGNKPTWRD
jgi:hypothetical protein